MAFIIVLWLFCVGLNFPMKESELDVFCICSAEMHVNLGIPWVIIGHSERRNLFNESNEVMCV